MKKVITENEMVELVKNAGFNKVLSFSFGPSGVKAIDQDEEIEAIRDEELLNEVRNFQL